MSKHERPVALRIGNDNALFYNKWKLKLQLITPFVITVTILTVSPYGKLRASKGCLDIFWYIIQFRCNFIHIKKKEWTQFLNAWLDQLIFEKIGLLYPIYMPSFNNIDWTICEI